MTAADRPGDASASASASGGTTTVAVVGGTGTIGARVVAALLARGAAVRVLSRNAAKVPAGAEHRRVDLITGDGLAEALAGADAVVDAANSNRTLEGDAGRGHRAAARGGSRGRGRPPPDDLGRRHRPRAVLLLPRQARPGASGRSRPGAVVDPPRHPVPPAARRGLRATSRASGCARPGRAKLQPIDPRVVAERLADAALSPPAGRLPDLAGPRVATISELSRAWASARGRRRLPLRIPSVGKAGKALAAGGLCAPDAGAGGEDFEEWLRHE